MQRARKAVLPEDFDHPVLRQMYEGLLEHAASGIWPSTPQELSSDPAMVDHWSRLLSYHIDPEVLNRIFEDGLREFARRHRQAPQIKKLIAQAERVGDHETAQRLTGELAEALRLDRSEAPVAETEK